MLIRAMFRDTQQILIQNKEERTVNTLKSDTQEVSSSTASISSKTTTKPASRKVPPIASSDVPMCMPKRAQDTLSRPVQTMALHIAVSEGPA